MTPTEPVYHEAKAAYIDPPSVPFGPQSIAGYTFSLAAFVAAVLAFIEGDRSDATVGTIVFGVASLVALVVTSRNRTEQAKNLAQLATRERMAPPPMMTQALYSRGAVAPPVVVKIGEREIARAVGAAAVESTPAPWPDPSDPPMAADPERLTPDDVAGDPPDDGLDGEGDEYPVPIAAPVPPEETRELNCGGDA